MARSNEGRRLFWRKGGSGNGAFFMAATSKIRWRRDITAVAKSRGWNIEATKGSHFRLTKGVHIVIAPGSPSNPKRSMANTLALMKRCEAHELGPC